MNPVFKILVRTLTVYLNIWAPSLIIFILKVTRGLNYNLMKSVTHLKDSRGMANSVNPDHAASFGAVYLGLQFLHFLFGLFVRMFRVNKMRFFVHLEKRKAGLTLAQNML